MIDFTGKTFGDFLLRPRYGLVNSRRDVNISTEFGPLKVDVPIISANMPDVTGEELAHAMCAAGGLALMPRDSWHKLKRKDKHIGATVHKGNIGYNGDVPILNCMDMAHADSSAGYSTWHAFGDYPRPFFMGVGNLTRPSAVQNYEVIGAKFVKVGIGAGSCCTTRLNTGIGVPQLQAIWECARVATVPIIADGGIRHPKDIVLSLLCGARIVMLGGMLARCKEAPNKGMIQGLAHRMIAPEGLRRAVDKNTTVAEVMQDIAGYIRSAVSYLGFNSLDSARRAVMAEPDRYLIPISEASRVESFER